MKTKAKQPVDQIAFDRGLAPIAMFFLVVPMLILVMIGITLMTHSFPAPLVALLLVLAMSCLGWIVVSVQEVGSVTIELGAEEIKVKRMLGGESYSWAAIDDIKLLNPGPSLSDSGRHDDPRAAIGLWMKAEKKDKSADLPPDVIIVSGSGPLAEVIVRSSERIISHFRRGGGGSEKASVRGFNRGRKDFRRPAAA